MLMYSIERNVIREKWIMKDTEESNRILIYDIFPALHGSTEESRQKLESR